VKPRIPALACVAAVAALGACGGSEPTSDTRVVVFGVDGLDPELLQERIDRGLCPNFAALLAAGATFAPLQTSWPPQSPVAWSNFITGTNPGKHGLYDFIHADPKTYGVLNSMSYTDPVGIELCLFGLDLPLTGGAQHLTRAFPAFWEVMADAGVPVAVFRMPANFPPQATKALTFPDMGTPDLTGAASGRAMLWSDGLDRSPSRGSSTTVRTINVIRDPGRPDLLKFFDAVPGPDNTLRCLDDLEAGHAAAVAAGDAQKSATLQAQLDRARETSSPFTGWIDTTDGAPQLGIRFGGIEDGREGEWVTAGVGEWTRWVPVSFNMAPFIDIGGYTRFYFKSADPVEIYGSPVQIDPFAPAMDISTPPEAAAELAEAIGPYYTQGFPDAYIAYKSDLLSTGEFVSQSDTVLEERGQMLDYALDRFDRTGGLTFFYVGSLDMRCHMLWHAQDPGHPHQEAGSEAYAGELDRIYSQVDGMLGELVARLEPYPDAELIVMSDHGFAPFHRKMHVNDWLLQEGYLVLKDDVEQRADGFWRGEDFLGGSLSVFRIGGHGEPDFEASVVDWSRSRAYCIGFNGVIFNRAGREARGIVAEAEVAALQQEIAAKLLALRDADGTAVFTRVLPAQEVFAGPMTGSAPDLQLGFNVGYGASDECATGGIAGAGILVDNDSRWSGSHLMDPELVRGTLIVRSGAQWTRDPRLEDITATLYRLFQVAPPDGLDGQPLY